MHACVKIAAYPMLETKKNSFRHIGRPQRRADAPERLTGRTRFTQDLALADALHDRQRPGARRKLSGKEEALLVATACSKPPAGRARWTLELLAGEVVRLRYRSIRRLEP